jgi:hypothetical protein
MILFLSRSPFLAPNQVYNVTFSNVNLGDVPYMPVHWDGDGK